MRSQLLTLPKPKRVVITMVMTTDMEAAETTDMEAVDTVASSLNMVTDMEGMKDMENMEVADTMAATLDTNSFLLLGLAFVVVLLISSHEVSAVDTTQTKESGDHYGHDHGHGGGGHRDGLSENGDGHGEHGGSGHHGNHPRHGGAPGEN
ncbi:hypothetical protein EZV62_008730 [Acer yangbiense]|uniref:Glycine-rich protein n=1 Tax=Acer yangbiense TaxID=1000413 RepID=A0A5C7IEN5_9ROSI|nr:hypothetical protein EZV62_008730 [Acer yangbiense]